MFTTMVVEQQAFQFMIWMSVLVPVTFLQIDPRCQGNIVFFQLLLKEHFNYMFDFMCTREEIINDISVC